MDWINELWKFMDDTVNAIGIPVIIIGVSTVASKLFVNRDIEKVKIESEKEIQNLKKEYEKEITILEKKLDSITQFENLANKTEFEFYLEISFHLAGISSRLNKMLYDFNLDTLKEYQNYISALDTIATKSFSFIEEKIFFSVEEMVEKESKLNVEIIKKIKNEKKGELPKNDNIDGRILDNITNIVKINKAIRQRISEMRF